MATPTAAPPAQVAAPDAPQPPTWEEQQTSDLEPAHHSQQAWAPTPPHHDAPHLQALAVPASQSGHEVSELSPLLELQHRTPTRRVLLTFATSTMLVLASLLLMAAVAFLTASGRALITPGTLQSTALQHPRLHAVLLYNALMMFCAAQLTCSVSLLRYWSGHARWKAQFRDSMLYAAFCGLEMVCHRFQSYWRVLVVALACTNALWLPVMYMGLLELEQEFGPAQNVLLPPHGIGHEGKGAVSPCSVQPLCSSSFGEGGSLDARNEQ